MKLGWSTDFILVQAASRAIEALTRVQRSDAHWVVVVWDRARRGKSSAVSRAHYVFTRDELFGRLQPSGIPDDPDSTATLAAVLHLRDVPASLPVTDSAQLPRGDGRRGPRDGALEPLPERTGERYVELERNGSQVLSVGGPDVQPRRRLRSVAGSAPCWIPPEPSATVTAEAVAAPPAEDEGTMPTRYPSIEPEQAPRAGAAITLVVDLLREESTDTLGATMFPQQATDWRDLQVAVVLQSPDIDFEAGGCGALTVRRNAATLPARLQGRVRAGLAAGHEIEVKAVFLLGTRFCGSAVRRLVVDRAAAPSTTPAGPATVQLDGRAQTPDLTIFITLFDRDAPGKLHWRMVTAPFPGCPPRLDGSINLGQEPAVEATALFKRFAKLERGQHQEAIEGFGEELWRRTPPEFQALYWALHDHLERPMTIQFVSDDPHLPWELASPYRDGEVHGPLALRHAVARWIGYWAGYMRNRLPAGRLVAIAPRYRSASARLSQAEAAAQALVDGLQAERLAGTREQVLRLLEQPPEQPVALLYFTGHGAFAADAAGASLIKLEDAANLSATEVARQKVRLGERWGTVVFLNACEVGATGNVLGNVGGWADAFLSRRFGAFIAPLWAIDEEDAKQVTEELMRAIVGRREPVGAALRDLRARHGAVSPTFYSYLLYGDVTARLGGAA